MNRQQLQVLNETREENRRLRQECERLRQQLYAADARALHERVEQQQRTHLLYRAGFGEILDELCSPSEVFSKEPQHLLIGLAVHPGIHGVR